METLATYDLLTHVLMVAEAAEEVLDLDYESLATAYEESVLIVRLSNDNEACGQHASLERR
jgi:hypothetical protein